VAVVGLHPGAAWAVRGVGRGRRGERIERHSDRRRLDQTIEITGEITGGARRKTSTRLEERRGIAVALSGITNGRNPRCFAS
jgi:hypothetical protein